MTVVRADTFTRANASGWGTASDGNTWTTKAGTGTEQISSNEGQLTSVSASYFNSLGAVLSTADAEGLVRVTFNGSTSDTGGIFIRFTDSNNYYLCRYDGAAHFEFLKKVSGTSTHLGQVAFTVTTGQAYWIRFRVQGSNLSGKMWQDGTSEPSSWTTTATDSALTTAEFAGLYGFASGTNTTNFDTFSVDDLTTPALTAGTAAAISTGSGGTTQLHLALTAGAAAAVSASPSATLSVSSGSQLTAGTAAAISAASGGTATLIDLTPPLHAGAAAATSPAQTATLTVVGGVWANPWTIHADTTKSVSWTAPSSGSDTETDYNAQNSAGDGVRLGVNPSYGGGPFSAWYELVGGSVVNAGQNSVNPGNQDSMATTAADGHLHALAASGAHGFLGTEDLAPFTLTELAPTQTAVRRYVTFTGTDAGGFTWTVSACVWPGNPTRIAWKVTVTNSSGSAIAMAAANSTQDNLEVETPAGLLSNTGSSTNQGVWTVDSTHSYFGTVAGGATGGIPLANTFPNTSGEPDFFAFVPMQNVGALTNQQLGVMTTKFTKWADVGLSASGYGALQNTSRVKSKWGGNFGASVANGTSVTLYLMEVFRPNLSTTDMVALAADYLSPGTPTVATGTLTTFSYPGHSSFPKNLDEGAYVIAADAHSRADLTLDMTPTGVTTRFHPAYKITGYQSTAAPAVTWGGALLTSGVDYNATVDTTNQVAYVHLQFDIVASGAGAGQRNNATLLVAPGAVALTAGTAAATSPAQTALLGTPLNAGTASAISASPAAFVVVATPLTAASAAAISGGPPALLAVASPLTASAAAAVSAASVAVLSVATPLTAGPAAAIAGSPAAALSLAVLLTAATAAAVASSPAATMGVGSGGGAFTAGTASAVSASPAAQLLDRTPPLHAGAAAAVCASPAATLSINGGIALLAGVAAAISAATGTGASLGQLPPPGGVVTANPVPTATVKGR